MPKHVWPQHNCTDAEAVQYAFIHQTQTTPVATLAALKSGARSDLGRNENGRNVVAWIFPDRSTLYTSGRGSNHQIWLIDRRT